MTRRGRLLATAGAASAAAVTGAVTLVGYTDSVSGRFGSLRPVVVTTAPIERGEPLTRTVMAESSEVRRIPSRFVPAGTLNDPSAAFGLLSAVDLPRGSYISVGVLRPPGRRTRSGPRPLSGLHPVEVTVHGAGAIPPGGGRFDVLVTPLDGRGRTGRTRVVSRSAAMIGRSPVDSSTPDQTSTRVTLAVDRNQAIRLIDAEARGERLTLLAAGAR